MSSETVATVGAGGISSVAQNTITAIDILLEPDATMIQHAEADNARLPQHFPKGYSLGRRACATHLDAAAICPHRRPGKNLCSCRHGVCQKRSDQLEAEGVQVLLHSGWPIGLAGIVIEPTPDLLRLQQELIDAVTPFTAPTGTAAAYETTPQDPNIVPQLIEYVRVFVPEHSGAHYSPHVTIGIGTVDYLNALLAAPFDTFTFCPVGASVYHLGTYGTAMTKLHSFQLKN
jgi:hypothetical protein